MTTINTNTTATTAFVVTPDTDGTFVVNTGSGVGAERMRITSTGAVGFGTSTPLWDLELEGVGDTYLGVTALASGTGTDDDAGIVIRAAQTGEAAIYFRQDDGDVTESVIFRTGGANDLRFQTNGTTQMVIDTSGNLQFNSGYGSFATAYGCRAWVKFDGTASGTFAGGASTVTRIAGSTTATVTTTTAHGLITGNYVQALTGVVAGSYVVTYISATQFSFTTVATTALTAVSITFAVNSINGSGNVSSISDKGVGSYIVNFATAMPDANYASVCGSPSHNTRCPASPGVSTTTAIELLTNNSANTANDVANVSVAIFR